MKESVPVSVSPDKLVTRDASPGVALWSHVILGQLKGQGTTADVTLDLAWRSD